MYDLNCYGKTEFEAARVLTGNAGQNGRQPIIWLSTSQVTHHYLYLMRAAGQFGLRTDQDLDAEFWIPSPQEIRLGC